MSDPFIGEVRLYGFSFAPKNWALCNGQLLPIAQNTALFSLLGTTFGGNGVTTFALPDLRSRLPVGFGSGAGWPPQLGEAGGTEAVILSAATMPAHTHALNIADTAQTGSPSGSAVLASSTVSKPYLSGASSSVSMASGVIAPSGGAQPHENMQPCLTLNFAIALVGIFPSHP